LFQTLFLYHFLKLEHGKIKIKEVQYGDQTFVEDGILFINKNEVISELTQDPKIKEVKFDIARPGEKSE